MMITFFGALSFLLSSSVVMAQWWWCTEGCHLKVFYLSSLLALEQRRTESSVVALIGIWSGLKASLLTEGMALILTTIIILCRHRGKKRCERISCYLVVERFDEKHATSWKETFKFFCSLVSIVKTHCIYWYKNCRNHFQSWYWKFKICIFWCDFLINLVFLAKL